MLRAQLNMFLSGLNTCSTLFQGTHSHCLINCNYTSSSFFVFFVLKAKELFSVQHTAAINKSVRCNSSVSARTTKLSPFLPPTTSCRCFWGPAVSLVLPELYPYRRHFGGADVFEKKRKS